MRTIADARIVAFEIGAVILDEFSDRRARSFCKGRFVAGFRCGHDHRPVLGADGVVGRDDAARRVIGDVFAIDEIEDGVARAEIENEPRPRAFVFVILDGAGAAYDRRDIGDARDLLRQLRTHEYRCAIFLQPVFGQRDQFDHALVGFARIGTEGEDAVLFQDQAFDLWIGVEHFRRFFGQAEAGQNIRHHAHARAIDFARAFRSVRLVDQSEHGGGMRVVDIFVRHEGVQQRLDRWIGRHWIDQIGALHAHHLVVGHGVAGAQLAQCL